MGLLQEFFMFNPFIELLSTVLSLYMWVVIIWVILQWLISFQIINRHQPFVYRVMMVLDRLTEKPLRFIRRYVPLVGGIDLSPLILILALQFTKSALYHWFWQPAFY